MAPQATRISIVFGCLVFAFAGVRTLIVPDSFGKTGHFRQAALGAIAAHPPKFEGKQPCIDCHANNTPHTDKGVSCETCHGPGAAHSKDFDSSKLVVDKTRNACGRCHAMNTARRSTFPQVDMAEHHGSQRCVECHNIHPEVPGKPIGDLKPAGIPKDEADAKPTAPVKPGAPAAATPPATSTARTRTGSIRARCRPCSMRSACCRWRSTARAASRIWTGCARQDRRPR